MTIREAYENCLIELNKVQAPSLLLDDFVYLFNKAIQKYINKRYNKFEVNQQMTDDLRVLLKTIRIDRETDPSLTPVQPGTPGAINVFGTSYTCELPNDYVHILNCICEFTTYDRCGEKTVQIGANKLDTAEWPHSIDNYYMKPSFKRPYYYISNIVDPDPVASASLPRQQKTVGQRYGNDRLPVMQIKCGDGIQGVNGQTYTLNAVYVDYLRAPEFVSVDDFDLDSVIDKTQNIEFPDYVTYEIINELVTLILENGQDKRIQTFPAVSQSVPQTLTAQQ